MSITSPWLRRHHRRMMWLLVALLVLPMVAAVAWFLATWDPRAFALAILMTLANIVNVINPIVFRRLKRRVREHHGLLCTACLFPLHGLDDAGTCPECGSAYDTASTIESWKRDLNMHKDPVFAGAQPSEPR